MNVPPWCCSLTSTPSSRNEIALPRMPLIVFPFTISGRIASELPVGGSSAAPGVSSASRKKPRPLSGRLGQLLIGDDCADRRGVGAEQRRLDCYINRRVFCAHL